MTHLVKLGLSRDVALGAAREHDVLLAVEDLRDGSGFRAARVPNLHSKDDGTLPGVVVEHRFDRRVRADAAVPVGLSVDADSRKRRRQCARSQHMVEADLYVPGVEISHLAAEHVDDTEGKSGLSGIHAFEVDNARQQLLERIYGIQRCLLDADLRLKTPGGHCAW